MKYNVRVSSNLKVKVAKFKFFVGWYSTVCKGWVLVWRR